MSLEIRPVSAAARDLPIFASWLWLQWGQKRRRSPARTLARIQGMATDSGLPFGFCAYWDGLPAGFACCTDQDLDSRPDLSPWLASVFVRPDARGHGIASAVVQAAADEAKVRGLSDLFLFTPDQQRLYARLGWTAIGEDFDADQDEAVTVMHRTL